MGKERRNQVSFYYSFEPVRRGGSSRTMERSLLVDSESESENNKPMHDGNTPSRKRHGGSSTPMSKHGKRARTRSRSRSLTPPPDLTLLERMRAQKAIQFVLVLYRFGLAIS